MPRAFPDTPDSDVILDDSDGTVRYANANQALDLLWINPPIEDGAYMETAHYTFGPGNSASLTFHGTRVAVYGRLSGTGAVANYTLVNINQTVLLTSTQYNLSAEHVLLYQSDPLPFANYTLTVTLEVGYASDNRIYLDWFEYNQTLRTGESVTFTPTPSPTGANSPSSYISSASLTSTASSSASHAVGSTLASSESSHTSEHGVPIAAIVGGAVGGFVAFLCVALVGFWLGRRRLGQTRVVDLTRDADEDIGVNHHSGLTAAPEDGRDYPGPQSPGSGTRLTIGSPSSSTIGASRPAVRVQDSRTQSLVRTSEIFSDSEASGSSTARDSSTAAMKEKSRLGGEKSLVYLSQSGTSIRMSAASDAARLTIGKGDLQIQSRTGEVADVRNEDAEQPPAYARDGRSWGAVW